MTVRSRKRETYGELLVSFARLPDLPPGAKLDDEGRLTLTFRTLELGAKEQDGRKFAITPKIIAEMAENFTWRRSRGYKTPTVIGHPGVGEKTAAKAWEERIKAPAVGWAQSVEAREDGLYVTVMFSPSFSRRLLDREYEFNSPTFAEQWVDEFGVERGAVLIDVGILNYPLQEGMGSILAASALAGGSTMDEEIRKILDEILSRLEALEKGGEAGGDDDGMDEMGKRLAALEESAKSAAAPPVEKTEEEKTQLAALRAEVTSLGAQLRDDVVKMREQLDESAKRTKESTDKAHAAECLRFLSAQLDDGKLLPERLPKDWKTKPVEAFDALGFRDLPAAVAHFAMLPRHSVVNLSGQSGRSGATDSYSLSDELWHASSMREQLIDRFQGDESKARRHYESLCSMPVAVGDED